MYRFSFSFLLVLSSFSLFAQTDSTAVEMPPVIAAKRQLRIGVDISRPVMNAVYKNRYSYEAAVDYFLPKELYLVAEGGFGGSSLDYEDLHYTSSNSFFKIGIDKSMLQRLFPSDWDFLFVGVRYGVALIQRNEAGFRTEDPVWGSTSGVLPSKSLTAHWAELTGGLRVELLKGFFAGYTVRGKFLISQSAFRDLPPYFIAGYGKGEKNTAFDFNFYLQYGLRW